MLRFLAHRTLLAAAVLWLVATAVFALVQVAPGPVEHVVAGPHATTETLALIRRNLGLDRPVPSQYAAFLGRLLQGDLGYSYINGVSVTELIAGRLPTTLCLILGAACLCLTGGVTGGVLSAVRPRGRFDRMATGFVLIGLSTPSFVLGLVLLHVFTTGLGELGITFFEPGPPLQQHFVQRMILPWITLAILMAAAYSRLTRAAMLEALSEDYIRTARAKGLPERHVTWRHALRPALSPVITQFGLDIGTLAGSTVVTEQVFGLQGLGQLVYRSISVGDVPVILGVALLAALFVATAGLAVDIAHAVLDPRVRPA